MCGLAGFIDFNKKSNRSDLVKMTDVLYHRGPNDSGYELYKLQDANVGLGHRRLSILDLIANMSWEDCSKYVYCKGIEYR